MPTEEKKDALSRALERARGGLLDLTRRNRLLNSSLTGNRTSALLLKGESPNNIFSSLYQSETRQTFKIRSHQQQDSQEINQQHLISQLDIDQLRNRLVKLYRTERTLFEEQGVNTLYLALGFLKWYESDSSDEPSLAPLILVPVSLQKNKNHDLFSLIGRDDEVMLNESLQAKLRDFGLSLPRFDEDKELNPSQYFSELKQKLTQQPRWEVRSETIALGLFQFDKFLMWRDLNPENWPNSGILNSKLLTTLLQIENKAEASSLVVQETEALDEALSQSQRLHVVNADSSQAIVVEEALRGRNLVVQGPPGTGKSQTITNIIAGLVYNGKSVLFVSEKMAALSVVRDRLDAIGLGPVCLELHSKAANKKAALASVQQALNTNVREAETTDDEKLDNLRKTLNQHSKDLHRQIGESGLTAFQVLGRLTRYMRVNTSKEDIPKLDGAETWTQAHRETVQRLAGVVSARNRELGWTPIAHPWHGTDIQNITPLAANRLKKEIESTVALVERLHSLYAHSLAEPMRSGHLSIDNAESCARYLSLIADAPEGSKVVAAQIWKTRFNAVIEATARVRSTAKRVAATEELFYPEVWNAQTSHWHSTIQFHHDKLLRLFSRQYRQALAEINKHLRNPRVTNQQRLRHLSDLAEAKTAIEDLRQQEPLLQEAWHSSKEQIETHWTLYQSIVDWATNARALRAPDVLYEILSDDKDTKKTAGNLSRDIQSLAREVKAALEALKGVINWDEKKLFGQNTLDEVNLEQLQTALLRWRDNIDASTEWSLYNKSIQEANALGLRDVVNCLNSGRIDANNLPSIVEGLVCEALWNRAARETPGLQELTGTDRSQLTKAFAHFDWQQIQSNRRKVISQYTKRKPSGADGEMGYIRNEINLRRHRQSLRTFVEKTGNALQKLKPVFLMSPISVAQFLKPGGLTFDVLIMDEASQITPSDALGSVARAKQIVVVGDDKQLPPTNFWRQIDDSTIDVEDEEEQKPSPDAGDFESVLALSRAAGIGERMLLWHYRSRHESLIALSNTECYGGNLLLPPSPSATTSELGLRLVRTPPGHYERGGRRRDNVQADIIAKAIAEHIQTKPTKSLGVATLSVAQRDAVEDAIDRLAIRGKVEEFLPKGERLFVKNLESVQGDERDVIFISIGYGPSADGPLHHTFGPVGREGGERRLNVLASRAREQCLVYSAFGAEEIRPTAQSRGTRMLRELLHFAETGYLAAGQVKGQQADSPFEEEVAFAIKSLGYEAHPQVGVSSFRIDIGVLHPENEGLFVLGVECDGRTYHSSRTARERDRLRQEVLENLGWRLHRIWSTDWFHNPSRETAKLKQAIEEAIATPHIARIRTEATVGLEQAISVVTSVNRDLTAAENRPTTPEYVTAQLKVNRRQELSETSTRQLAQLAYEVIRIEQPIHFDEVCRRIREAYGLNRTGSRIERMIQSALSYLAANNSAFEEEAFWSLNGFSLQRARNRSKQDQNLRNIERIAPAEYRRAILDVLQESVGIAPDELPRAVGKRLGYDRITDAQKYKISSAAKHLIQTGEIKLTENRWILSDGAQ